MVPHAPIRLDRAALRRLHASEVVTRCWPNAHLPYQYFKLMDEDLPVSVGPCGHFFEADEYEMVCAAPDGMAISCIQAYQIHSHQPWHWPIPHTCCSRICYAAYTCDCIYTNWSKV